MFRKMMPVAAALLAGAVMPQVLAAKQANNESAAVRGARYSLQDIQANIVQAERETETIGQPAMMERMSWQVQQQYLTRMKDNLNQIGAKVKRLEAEQDSLALWEREALAEIVPTLHDAATNVDLAIRELNENQISPWHSHVAKYAAKAGEDEQKAMKTLHAYFKMDNAARAEKKSREELQSVSGL